ncbi:MAG TPA: YraN family protein [Blastocatellia bacterium]|nr:YraN family protein [Blastocatellia bacterium]
MLNPIRKLFSGRYQNQFPGASASSVELGAYGERLAIDHLKRQGYRIVATNYTAPIGRSLAGRVVTGEIDIIAYDESGAETTLAFIEVKTRASAEFALPQAAVDVRKQRQIARAARVYRRILQLEGEPYRYDVASVIAVPGAPPEIAILKAYFTETRFSRSGWWSREEAGF